MTAESRKKSLLNNPHKVIPQVFFLLLLSDFLTQAVLYNCSTVWHSAFGGTGGFLGLLFNGSCTGMELSRHTFS